MYISSNTGWFGRDKTKFGDKKVIIPVDVPGASWVSTVGDLEHQPPSWGSPTMVVVMITITIIITLMIILIIIIILCIKQSDNIRYSFSNEFWFTDNYDWCTNLLTNGLASPENLCCWSRRLRGRKASRQSPGGQGRGLIHRKITFYSWIFEGSLKVKLQTIHAVVARSTFASQKC